MVREIAINIYLAFFSFFFNIFKIFPVQRKIVFCISFVENAEFIYKQLIKNIPDARIVLISDNIGCFSYFRKNSSNNDTVLLLKPKKLLLFLRSIYHLATAKVIILDNYFGFLSAVTFRKEVKKVQIWHAAGAIKKFGLKDPSIKHRSKKANQRFQHVYNQFENIIVGSKKMEYVFMEAFGAKPSQFIYSGIPRTDIFFDEAMKMKIIQDLSLTYPSIKDKKILLYAPTFRDDQLDNYQLPIDIPLLKENLGENYLLILKLHPAIKTNIDIETYKDFVLNLSNYKKINDLLFITDYLITDYSSIPFEFSFLQKPMIFFPYDLEEYTKNRGMWEPYEGMVPGPVVHSTEEIVNTIINNSFRVKEIQEFHQEWNTFSIGNSSSNLSALIIDWVDNK
ncbi:MULTISPECIES: CDP-glycerol glycerophosphotransferase family protein [Bacillaceae]|jgi:teichoic acid glycerol-phosphate primase|uniref:CDP-glycerol glycerophosphotransferase family protein n=1 Tax=Bacillaceae TaxID=186817 RepID=UPI001F1D7A90|nr:MULTISPECIES: CDP-glycerol glycerophosphotransferase family protein [Bacillaceae]MCF2647756.1 CDP-glycerol glycerophosphotransferase family protein [Niallia circulans]CAI9385747.1 Teichoic acid glycerol-phosphate primase [Bacillus sp. T2.9-1]